MAIVDYASLPKSMRDLKRDERGYPIPWFVDYHEGKPEFRSMDPKKYLRAVKGGFCWTCGGKIHYDATFVAGPMCGINRTSAEPPSHPNCATWSAKNCPFLNNPRSVRREDELLNKCTYADSVPGIGLSRNPGVVMLWHTRSYEVFADPRNGKPLITMGEPLKVEWYREGREATLEEVQHSIDTGMHNLRLVAKTERGGLEWLEKQIQLMQPWLPEKVSA